MPQQQIWAQQVWMHAANETRPRWHQNVRLTIDGNGFWRSIECGVPITTARAQSAEVLSGALLPGVVNAHCHAFQRAFAGLAERRDGAQDSFWSWRDRMYQVALNVTPDQLYVIAKQLYIECMRAGYTHICEFHYLHRDRNGAPFADDAEMLLALTRAASEVGIALTLLPVIYERAGFSQPTLRDDQRRFSSTVEWVLKQQQRFQNSAPLLNCGVAIHSLRAVAAGSVKQVATTCSGPIHIHVAEQIAEVEESIATTGARPIEWLLTNVALDSRWSLVHATHVAPHEIVGVAQAGANVVLCPTTEANLGDGLTPLRDWLAADVPLAIGSDSNVCRDWREEIRLAEYGQRLARRQRNIAAQPARDEASSGAVLFNHAIRGGALAAGVARADISIGARADAIVIDVEGDCALVGVPHERLLDALIFSSPSNAIKDVMVAGAWRIRERLHPDAAHVRTQFARVMKTLYA